MNSSAGTAIGFDAEIGMAADRTPGTLPTQWSTAVGTRAWILEGAYSSTAIGNETRVFEGAHESTAIGAAAKIGANSYGSVALGHAASVGPDSARAVAIGQWSSANHANSVALGFESTTRRGAESNYAAFGIVDLQSSIGEVAIGTNTGNRTITGVAAGRDDYDAVNVQQLSSVSSNVASIFGGGSTLNDNGVITAPTYVIQGTGYNDVGSAFSAVDFALSDLATQITTEAGKAGAVGLAASSLRFDDRPGKLSLAVGGGFWSGQGAVAFGGGYTSEDEHLRANLTGTTTGDKWGVGGGVSFTLN